MAENKEVLNLQLTWEDPESGRNMDRVLPLPVTIGRDFTNHVVLSSASVSRYHAKIEFEGEAVIVKDLQSSNGTMLNGESINQATIKEGDKLEIGGTSISIEFTMGRRANRPSMDKLFGALIESESEPTITLSSLDKKALFADLEAQPTHKVKTNPLVETQELTPPEEAAEAVEEDLASQKLTGDELKSFVSNRLQKDIDQDISPDVQSVAGMFKAPRNMIEANKAQDQNRNQGFLGKLMSSVKKLFGG